MSEMIEVKVEDLEGTALDWAVAKCLDPDMDTEEFLSDFNSSEWTHAYSQDWAQAGPVMEKERIDLEYQEGLVMADCTRNGHTYIQRGETALIAAMRCYVLLKAGFTVEVPVEFAPKFHETKKGMKP